MKIFDRTLAVVAFVPALIFLSVAFAVMGACKAFVICMECAREWWL